MLETGVSEGTGIGKPIERVDGRIKLTGEALFTADVPVEDVTYATIVSSTVARGVITGIEAAEALDVPGVLAVMTHENRPEVSRPKPDFRGGGITAEIHLPLSDTVVHHVGQHVAVVVASTLEAARHAASLVRVTYREEPARLDPMAPGVEVREPEEFFGDQLQGEVGDFEWAYGASDYRHEGVYVTAHEHHNPIEPSGTLAIFEEDGLTVYDATQWIAGTRAILSDMMGLPLENVRVVCPYLGGSFGCKGLIWPHTLLTVMAAKLTGKPVKLVLSRAQMYTGTGHRTLTHQTIRLGASKEGRLTAIEHVVRMPGSEVGPFVEYCAVHTSCLGYDVPNIRWKHQVVPLNLPEPTFMRAPGGAPGTFALESALDELSYELGIDPLDLRLENFARSTNPTTGKPFSTNFLEDCYLGAAERFGWRERNPEPGSMRDGELQVGYGMATIMHNDVRYGGACRLVLTADGHATLSTSAHEMGQGAYTALAQIAADELGLETDDVTFLLGDSNFPFGPLAANSCTTSTVAVMIYDAVDNLAAQLGVREARGKDLVEAVRQSGQPSAQAMGFSQPGEETEAYSFKSFGAYFVEVAIDPLMPRVEVRRVVSKLDVGRVINPKMARSQVVGAAVMGIGMALMEETLYDPHSGRTVNDNLADYAVPVNADIPPIEVMFTDQPDMKFNPSGARGVGEIGITGISAAIANAVFHATGIRVRRLPILPGSLL